MAAGFQRSVSILLSHHLTMFLSPPKLMEKISICAFYSRVDGWGVHSAIEFCLIVSLGT